MKLANIKGKVDFAVLTIREDEFRAVLDRLPAFERVAGKRQYNLSRVELAERESYLVAVIRCTEQGTGEALDAARDLLEDLAPAWLLVVGIAGGVPSDDFTLGDVVVSTRIHDFSVEAVLQDRAPAYALAGGPLHKKAGAIAANLPALDAELSGWSSVASIGVARPPVEVTKGSLYGDEAWRAKVEKALLRHASRSEPLVTAGAIASSDRLVKGTEELAVWLKFARQVIAVEMEAAGVYRAAHGRQVPMLAIRGISDVVGFKRDPGWTRYACHSAAAFTLAFLRSRPIAPKGKAPKRGARTSAKAVAKPSAGGAAVAGNRLHVFVSYSHKDAALKEALLVHLRGIARFSGADVWTDNRIRPGDDWHAKIEEGLGEADVALLLLSPGFLASKFINDEEVPKLLDRHSREGVRVIPVLLKSCAWEVHPVLGKFQMLPTGAAPVASFTGDRRERALADVAREIARLAKERGAGE